MASARRNQPAGGCRAGAGDRRASLSAPSRRKAHVAMTHASVQAVITAGTEVPASLNARFLARLIDTVVLFIPLVAYAAISPVLGDPAVDYTFVQLILGLAVIAFLFGYEFVATGRTGQTWGKRALGIRVVRLDGTPVGYGTSAARYYVQALVSGVTCGLGGFLFSLSPLFDSSPWRRSWNDKIAETVVVVDSASNRRWQAQENGQTSVGASASRLAPAELGPLLKRVRIDSARVAERADTGQYRIDEADFPIPPELWEEALDAAHSEFRWHWERVSCTVINGPEGQRAAVFDLENRTDSQASRPPVVDEESS